MRSDHGGIQDGWVAVSARREGRSSDRDNAPNVTDRISLDVEIDGPGRGNSVAFIPGEQGTRDEAGGG